LCSIIFSQDRTYLFFASPSESAAGWGISENTSYSERFPVSTALYDDYFLEKIHIYYILESASANITVSIREDNNGSPGEVLDGAEWDITIVGGHGGLSSIEEYIFYTTSNCVFLEKDNYYWISLLASDEESSIRWANTSSTYYLSSTSNDYGETWSVPQTGIGGAGKIAGEAVFYAPEIDFSNAGAGDVNLDGGLNVLDVVSLSGYILGTVNLSEEGSANADFNSDGGTNVLDVVGLVNEILSPTVLSWLLEDINPNSSSFGNMIGPPTYYSANKISGYYFGKGG